MKNVSPVTQLHEHNLQIYRANNSYLLVSSNGDVLMSFTEKISSSSNSLRISLQKESSNPNGLAFSVSDYLGATQIDPRSLGNTFLNFMFQCYKSSIDYKVKGNQFAERARAIQKRCGIPWTICKLLATLSDEDHLIEAIIAIEDARMHLFDVLSEKHLSVALGTNKHEKRQLLKELLGCSVYEKLRLEERGKGYLNALTDYISSMKIEEFDAMFGILDDPTKNNYSEEDDDSYTSYGECNDVPPYH